MLKRKYHDPNTYRALGALGIVVCIALFIHEPSFPTLDKLVFFLLFGFMIFGQAIEAIKRFSPFVLLIMVYESFRGIADQLNTHIDYNLAPHADKWLFGKLPTVRLQDWLWHGQVRWYDYVLYLPYFLHFVLPLCLGILVWKTRESHFWRVMNSFLLVAFMAFVTYLILPAAPPWLASQNGYIEPITRISSQVWSSLGIHDFPTLYHHISPNAVAAVPSLHAAWAILLPLFIYKLYGWRWSVLAGIYPFLIIFGTIYDGEHYAFDIMAGVVYALVGYKLTPYVMRWGNAAYTKVWAAGRRQLRSLG